MTDYVGRRLGDYLIQEPLGSGGMGAVYAARHERGFRRAVKVQTLSTDRSRERFAREVRALAKVDQHPGVVGIHAHGWIGDRHEVGYAVMDLVEGETLGARLQAGELPVAEVLRLGTALAEALAHIHAAGITHRDLKPDNVLIRAGDGEPVLTDFGLARDEEEERMTASGHLLGTLLYMSPEQAGGKSSIGPPSDVFSLGAVLYEMLAGQRPFQGHTPFEVLRQIASVEPEELRVVRAEVSPALSLLVASALAKEPEARPTAAMVAEDLARIGRGEDPRRRTKRQGAWRLTLALTLAAAGASALVLIGQNDAPATTPPVPAPSGANETRGSAAATIPFAPIPVGVSTRLRCRFEQSYRSAPARQILVLEFVSEGRVVRSGAKTTTSGRVTRVLGRVTDVLNDLRFDSAHPERTSGTAKLVVGDALGLVGQTIAVTFTHNGPAVEVDGMPREIRVASARFDPGLFVRRRMNGAQGCFPVPLTGATSWRRTSPLLKEFGTRVRLDGSVELACSLTRTDGGADIRYRATRPDVRWSSGTPAITSFELSGAARIRDGAIRGARLELSLSGRSPTDGPFQFTSKTEYQIDLLP